MKAEDSTKTDRRHGDDNDAGDDDADDEVTKVIIIGMRTAMIMRRRNDLNLIDQ